MQLNTILFLFLLGISGELESGEKRLENVDNDHLRIFDGPGLLDDTLASTAEITPFEETLIEVASLPPDLVDFLLSFIPPDLSEKLRKQEISQISAEFQRTNYELLRSVESIKHARHIDHVRMIILGSVRFNRERTLDLCEQWDDNRRLCRYMSALSTYYLWVHLCGSLQYSPLINAVCSNWPKHLFQDLHLYEVQPGGGYDISSYFK